MWPSQQLLFTPRASPAQMRFREIPFVYSDPPGLLQGTLLVGFPVLSKSCQLAALSPLCHPVPKVPLSGSCGSPGTVDTKLRHRKRDS